MKQTNRHIVVGSLLVGLAAVLCAAAPADAQPFAYVLGQRDDPGGGNSGQSTVSVINTANNTIVQAIPVGVSCLCVNPDSAVISRDGKRVYVANEVANTVSVIDTATNTIAGTINVGVSLSSLALSPDGETLYVLAQPAQMAVYVFSTTTNALETTVPLAGITQARGMAVTPDGTRLYVSTYMSAGAVKVIDTASFGIVATVPVGAVALGVDITPDGSRVYVANLNSNTVSVISTATNTVVATVAVPGSPRSARVTPDGSRVFVANGSAVSVINTQTNTIVGSSIAVPNPRTLEFTPDGTRAYVATDQSVQVINTTTLVVTPTIPFVEATHGHPAALAMTPPPLSGPLMRRDKALLRFAAVTNGASFLSQTSAQVVRLTQIGAGTVTWTASPTEPWIQVAPTSGTGPANLSISVVAVGGLPASGSVNGAVRLNFSGAAVNVTNVSVTLKLIAAGTTANPFGTVDTPADNRTGVTGAVPFTGWALDDIEVTRVMVCRAAFGAETAPVDPNCGGAAQIFVGFAIFIDGARPDVAGAFSTYPAKTRAGWGFMVLTNMLPSQGNGTYVFHMWAEDREGHPVLLGTRTMTCANAGATLPFGAIDTPEQGGVASGGAYVNFGWALTPMPKTIPTNGSTISVLVDGVAVGTASYNHFRSDIANLFPGLNNSNAAIGFRVIDTTTLANGTHTIVWVVSDDQGATEGIGSRFFTVSNGAGALTAAADLALGANAPAHPSPNVAALPLDRGALVGRRGWDLEAPLRAFLANASGQTIVRSEEVSRVELQLGPGRHEGYLRTSEGLAALPIGSRLDADTGVFTWAPGAGFVGAYDFVFVRQTGDQAVARQEVRITLQPKGTGSIGPQVVIDTPRAQQDVGQPFVLAGWAADLNAPQGTGIATLHAWAYPLGGGPPVFLGATAYGGARPDVAAVHGDRFSDAGFGLVVQGLIPGHYDLAVFAWSTERADFVPARTVRITVR